MFRESGAYEPNSKMGKWLGYRGAFGHFNYFRWASLHWNFCSIVTRTSSCCSKLLRTLGSTLCFDFPLSSLTMNECRRCLGDLIFDGTCRTLKMISGLIIHEMWPNEIPTKELWPPPRDPEIYRRFPKAVAQNSQWVLDFEKFASEQGSKSRFERELVARISDISSADDR